MKKILIVGIMLFAAPFVSFAQTETTTSVPTTGTITITNPGLLPGDFFYFLDRWSEALNIAVTFNKENKARKHIKFAKERIAEMKDVLKDSKAKLEDIAEAKADFDERLAKAAAIVKEEKDKGSDVKNLAKELDDELDDAREELKDIFKDHKDEYAREELEIRAKIAALAPGDPQIKGLTQALLSITKEKDESNKEEENVDNDLTEEHELFGEAMGKELSARKHFEKAMQLKTELEAMKDGLVPSGSVLSAMVLLDQAKAADLRGDFEAAKKLSKQASKMLEKAIEMSRPNGPDSDHDDIPDSIDLDDDNDGTPDMKDLDDDGDGVSDVEESQNEPDIDNNDVNDLDQELQKGERMMDALGR